MLVVQLVPDHWETLTSHAPKHAREQRREDSIKAAHERLEEMRSARKERVKKQQKCASKPQLVLR
jgi:hypothetical protein